MDSRSERRARTPGPAALALTWLVVGAWACGSSGPYVWVADLQADPAAGTDYVIESGDVLGVRVFNQEAMSTKARVRTDGKISVPFAGDVQVSGKSPVAVARELEARLKSYVVTPSVTVTVDEFQSPSIAVIGEVAHPGVYNIDSAAGVLRALALAGGMTDYASHSNIYVLRRAAQQRIRFSYHALTDNEPRAAAFRLHAGDTIVVE
jgi:polysaccharide export outer membrane protein